MGLSRFNTISKQDCPRFKSLEASGGVEDELKALKAAQQALPGVDAELEEMKKARAGLRSTRRHACEVPELKASKIQYFRHFMNMYQNL